MQLLIFLGHSGTARTLYNVILETLVVIRRHNIARMEKKMMKKRRTQWSRLWSLFSFFLSLFFFFLKCLVRKDYKRKRIEQGAVTSKRTKGLKSRGFLFRLNRCNLGSSRSNGGSREPLLWRTCWTKPRAECRGGLFNPSGGIGVCSETCPLWGRSLLTGALG